MSSSYTNLLGLVLPVQGELEGTWGDTVNQQLTQLLDDAVANAVTLNLTAGDVTLTSLSGAADQARMAILIVTGTPGVTRTVTAPSKSKVYQVINQSDSSVVIKGAATTGVTILAGASGVVAWNGSDFIELGAIASNRTINGVLQLSAGTVSAPSLTTTGDTNTGLYFPAADTVAIATGATERARITSDGNLGIATTSPTSKLHVKGSFRIESEGAQWFSMGAGASGASYGAFLRGGTTTLVGLIGTDGGAILSGGTGDNFGIRAESALLLAAGATERARITSDGNLLVGCTSGGGYPTARLSLSTNSNNNVWNVGPYSISSNFIISQGTGGVVLNGTATAWSAISDEREKTEIKTIENATRKICTLRAGTGRYLNDEEHVSRSFLIAQDVLAVLPEAVDVCDDEQKTLMLRYTDVIPLLVAGIQEQQALIEAQKTAIESLTARITALEAK